VREGVIAVAPAAAWSVERADTGKIIMSFAGTNWHEFQSWRFDFRSLDGKHTDWMSFIDSVPLLSDHLDVEGADDYGAVRILSLPAGECEINTFSLSYATTTFTPRSDVSVRFTVKAGETTYIGSYMTIMTGITSGISYRITGGYIIVSDQHARDLAIAAKKGWRAWSRHHRDTAARHGASTVRFGPVGDASGKHRAVRRAHRGAEVTAFSQPRT
jgi:hypothetical protein